MPALLTGWIVNIIFYWGEISNYNAKGFDQILDFDSEKQKGLKLGKMYPIYGCDGSTGERPQLGSYLPNSKLHCRRLFHRGFSIRFYVSCCNGMHVSHSDLLLEYKLPNMPKHLWQSQKNENCSHQISKGTDCQKQVSVTKSGWLLKSRWKPKLVPFCAKLYVHFKRNKPQHE